MIFLHTCSMNGLFSTLATAEGDPRRIVSPRTLSSRFPAPAPFLTLIVAVGSLLHTNTTGGIVITKRFKAMCMGYITTFVSAYMAAATYTTIGDPFTDITVSPLRAVRRPGVAAVTSEGLNFGVAITCAVPLWDGVAIVLFWDRP